MIKQLTYAFLTSLLVAGVFLTYMFLIGIPKTKARNYYNLGMIERQEGNEDEAQQNFKKALEFWEEDYIKKELENN